VKTIEIMLAMKSPYIELIFDSTHWTPCQASKQGSPPLGTHPGSKGDPSAVYKLFMAKTTRKTKYDL